jgi:hypothetical protein
MEDEIGELAGEIWDFLEESGESSLTQVNDAVEAPRSRVNMAIGWLAREDKLVFNDQGRGVSVGLK